MILNVNNMRDIDNDAKSDKQTIAVRLGLKHAKIYHTALMLTMFACFITYSFIYARTPWYRLGYVIVYAFQIILLTQIFKKEGRDLDPYLRKTAMSAFLLAAVFSVCVNF